MAKWARSARNAVRALEHPPQPLRLGPGKGLFPPAPGAGKMHVFSQGSSMVLSSALEVSMGEHSQLLEHLERPIDRRWAYARHSLCHLPGEPRGADVALRCS